jgi:acetyl esterase
MPLHPQCQTIVDAAKAAGVPFEADDFVTMRKFYTGSTAIYRHSTPALDSVANLVFAGPAGNVPLRMYRPHNPSGQMLPVLVFYHGGGWVVGDLDTHDHVCRYLAGHAGVVVAAVDYRLAPEHKFPAAFDDACAAVRWITGKASDLGIDRSRVAVGGDSAGGNLAAAVALALRDEGDVPLSLQLLIYPALDFTADNDSLRDNGKGYMLTRAAMEQFSDWYLPKRITRTDPHASPQLAADHSGLPAAFIQTAEFDPLRDEAIAYSATLRQAGVPVEHRHYEGMIHGFARMGGKVDTALTALDDAAAALRGAFGSAS